MLGSDVQRITLFVATFGQSPDWLPAEAPDGDAAEVAGVDTATLGDFVDSAAGDEITATGSQYAYERDGSEPRGAGDGRCHGADPIKDGCIQRVTISIARQALGH